MPPLGAWGLCLKNMTIKDKIIIYIYNKSNDIEMQTEQLNHQLRYYPMDSLEMYEIMRQKVYVTAWKEFLDELFKIVINCK